MKYIVVVILLSLLACNIDKKNDESLKSKIEKYKKIKLPNAHEELHNRKSLKIVTYINGDCYACVKELAEWKEWFVNDSSNVQFLFFYNSSDTVHFNYVTKEYFDIGYPLIYDKESDYLSKNDIKKEETMFQTFLLDKDNNVLLVGNPLHNKKLVELYKREIKNRTKQNINHSHNPNAGADLQSVPNRKYLY